MKNLTASTTKESEKDCAQTPKWFVESLESYLGVNFELDVCCAEKTAKCLAYYSIENNDNGLAKSWLANNFCNPPFTQCLNWIEKAILEAERDRSTAMILPNNPETEYIRFAKQHADTIIEMPFRLKFLKPDGTKFVDKNGREAGPQFSCLVAWFTPLGLKVPTRFVYHDFREGFYK